MDLAKLCFRHEMTNSATLFQWLHSRLTTGTKSVANFCVVTRCQCNKTLRRRRFSQVS